MSYARKGKGGASQRESIDAVGARNEVAGASSVASGVLMRSSQCAFGAHVRGVLRKLATDDKAKATSGIFKLIGHIVKLKPVLLDYRCSREVLCGTSWRV